MNESSEKIQKIESYLSRIHEIFEKRPGMLGSPEEICAALTFLDEINDILIGRIDLSYAKQVSWNDFLIEKKLIVGAENKLADTLRKNEYDYSYLQNLRVEYALWKEKRLTS